MASKVLKAIKKIGKANDKLVKKGTLPGTQYVLLKNDGRSNKFIQLMVLDKTRSEYSAWRKQTKVITGRNDDEFVSKLREATDIGIGVAPNFEIYQIEQRDKAAPDLERPWWEYYGTKTGEKWVKPNETP